MFSTHLIDQPPNLIQYFSIGSPAVGHPPPYVSGELS